MFSLLYLCNAAGFVIVMYSGIANPQIHINKDLYTLGADNFTTIHITVRSLSTPINDSNLNITLQFNNINQDIGQYKRNISNGEYLLVYPLSEPGVYNIHVTSGRLNFQADKGFVVTSMAAATTTTSTTTSTLTPSSTTSIISTNTTG